MSADPFRWIDPWAELATHREALAMERQAYARADADRRAMAASMAAAEATMDKADDIIGRMDEAVTRLIADRDWKASKLARIARLVGIDG